LEAIQQTKLLTISKISVEEAGEQFAGKMVLLGLDNGATDRFKVVGREPTFPGVYIHASGAYTFAHEPIYEFQWWFRLLLDALLSVLIVCWVTINRFRHLNDEKKYDWHKFQSWLSISILIFVAIIAVGLVYSIGIIWLDFLLVIIFLWFHPKLEKLFSKLMLRLRPTAGQKVGEA
jgi:hypothetical protein